MNLQNIISEIAKADPELYERTSMRRDVIKNWSRKVALTAVPFALGSLFNKAYGKATLTVVEVLNFALQLEYLEARYYANGLASASLITAADKTIIQAIANDEAAHVAYLKTAIQAAGGTPISEPAFDYTAKGTFPDVFTNYTTFLSVAQAFEDTGVRAYKGQGANLQQSPDTLTQALRIHSVEGRHAAQIRLMRTGKPWITLANSDIPSAAVNGIYVGEDNKIQANIDVTTINGASAELATENFDEPLTKDQVMTIITPFLQ